MPYHGDSIPIADYAGTRFEPSNGTCGEIFHAQWCENCARDKVMNGEIHQNVAQQEDYCVHLNESFHSGGTAAWVFDAKGWPKCTEFIKAGEAIPERDDLTIDMFGTEPAALAPGAAGSTTKDTK